MRGNNDNYQNNRNNYMNNPPMNHSNGWNNQNRGNLDMPNLQALGINPQGQNSSNQGQGLNNNPLGSIINLIKTYFNLFSCILILIFFFLEGVGLNLNALPVNPAIVAAALNQWGLMGNLGGGGGGGGNNDQVSEGLTILII